MKIDFSSYALLPMPSTPRPQRHGALLKIQFDDDMIGYADCHPWPELGDLPLKQQLEHLAQGKTTTLLERSFALAGIDAEARAGGYSLFRGLTVPKSHWLAMSGAEIDDTLAESLLKQGFEAIKVKAGTDFLQVLKGIEERVSQHHLQRLRFVFDFNCKLDYFQFRDMLTQIESWGERIECFEDPIPFEPELWTSLQKQYGSSLACDKDSLKALHTQEACTHLVIKPAIQPIEPFLSPLRGNRRLIVTSYLDHPIGVLGAAYTAAKAASETKDLFAPCGLLTHYTYQPMPFCQEWRAVDPILRPSTDGTGWGFDYLLETLKWEHLR